MPAPASGRGRRWPSTTGRRRASSNVHRFMRTRVPTDGPGPRPPRCRARADRTDPRGAGSGRGARRGDVLLARLRHRVAIGAARLVLRAALDQLLAVERFEGLRLALLLGEVALLLRRLDRFEQAPLAV